jgi:hypothetical protein
VKSYVQTEEVGDRVPCRIHRHDIRKLFDHHQCGRGANNNETIVQPAGFSFSIWGLIYILLFIWIIKAFFAKTWEESVASRLEFCPIVNFMLNALWIIVFTQQRIFDSVIVIIALLYTLAEMYTTLTETGCRSPSTSHG